MLNNQKRETLPLWQWFSTESRYFLAEPEERRDIIILLTEEMGDFADQAFIKWELEQ